MFGGSRIRQYHLARNIGIVENEEHRFPHWIQADFTFIQTKRGWFPRFYYNTDNRRKPPYLYGKGSASLCTETQMTIFISKSSKSVRSLKASGLGSLSYVAKMHSTRPPLGSGT